MERKDPTPYGLGGRNKQLSFTLVDVSVLQVGPVLRKLLGAPELSRSRPSPCLSLLSHQFDGHVRASVDHIVCGALARQ